MKVAAGIPSVSVAHCEYNRSHIEQLIARAAEAQAEIAVFPELCLTGYTCQDLFFQQHLLEEAELSLMKLADATRSLNIISIVGLPLSHGGALYNCAAVIFKGKILGIVPKSYLPNYKEFYEMRWFASGLQVANTTIGYAGQTVPFGRRLLFQTSSCTFGVEICEDVWAPTPPSSEMVLEGAEVIFNLSADNDVVGKNHYLQQLLVQQSARCLCGYVFASSGYGESTQDVVFGGKAFVCEDGHLLAQAKRFSTEEQLLISEIDVERVRNERMTNTTFTSSLHKQSTYDTIDSLALFDRTDMRLTRPLQPHPFVQLWDDLLAKVRSQAEAYEPAYSEMAVVKYFESQLSTVIAKPHSQSENCQFITPTALPFVWRISMPRILCGAIAASTASRARSARRQASPA